MKKSGCTWTPHIVFRVSSVNTIAETRSTNLHVKVLPD